MLLRDLLQIFLYSTLINKSSGLSWVEERIRKSQFNEEVTYNMKNNGIKWIISATWKATDFRKLLGNTTMTWHNI